MTGTMIYYYIRIAIYLGSFVLSFFALQNVQFEKFTNVRKPLQVQLLCVLLAIGLAYVVSKFFLGLTIQGDFY